MQLLTAILLFGACRFAIYIAVIESKGFDYDLGFLKRDQWKKIKDNANMIAILMAMCIEILYLRLTS